jgi:MFS family permease
MRELSNKRYLLGVLMVILTFNYVDRLALGLVMQNIKADLALSDTQLGLLSGIAFALFYAAMGIPIARWADRGNRVLIISLTTAVWSVLVAMCGLAASFTQLLLIRVGVAVGEAGCIPPAQSLISDYFTRAERPRAAAIYMLGASASTLVGYFLGGWLNELYGWRAMFMILGLPGLALAALVRLSLRDPRQGRPRSAGTANVQPMNLREVCATLWRNATFRHLLFCFSISAFFGYGILQWQPAFFIRSYGLSTGQLGTWFAAIYGFGGIAGTYLGGELASRRAPANEPLQLKVMAFVFGSFAFVSALIYLSPNRYWAFGLMSLAASGGAVVNGPLFATIQTLVPQRMRAVSIAIVYLFANLIGMGLGPLVAGALSDALRPHFGEESLRYALLILSPGYLWCGWHLWRASSTAARDIEVAQTEYCAEAAVGD